jgi:drug/metabolite transporter (DMT)-like permease
MSPSARPVRGRGAVAPWVADAALVGVTLIWGVTFPVVKGALGDAGPLSFNAVRFTLAAALLLPLARPRRLTAATWGAGAVLGVLLAAGYALQTVGLARISPSASAFLTSTSVILVPLLLAAGWRRKLPPQAWWSSLLALAGLALLLGPTAGGARAGVVAGDALTLGCAVAFALQIIALGEWAPRYGFRELAALQIGFAALATWLTLPLLERPHWHWTPRLWIAIVATAALATALAFFVQSWAQQFTPAAHTAVVFAFEPVFAWLAALIGWRQGLRPLALAGAGMILAAMLLLEWRPRARPPAAS